MNIQEAPDDRVENDSQIEDAYESLQDFVASSSQDELTKTAPLATQQSQEELKDKELKEEELKEEELKEEDTKEEEELEPQVDPPEEPSAIDDPLLEHNLELEASQQELEP